MAASSASVDSKASQGPKLPFFAPFRDQLQPEEKMRVGRGNRRPGDWNCPECGDHQFATRTECRKCGTPKPTDGEDGEAESPEDWTMEGREPQMPEEGGQSPDGGGDQSPEGDSEEKKLSGEDDAGAGPAILSGAEGSQSSIGETIQTSGTFGGGTGAGSGTDGSVKRQRGNRGGRKVQEQKRLREEREAWAQGAKGGWSAKRWQGVVVPHGDRPISPRDAYWNPQASWKKQQRESAAQAWNQRLQEKQQKQQKQQKPSKEGFHQGYRRLTPLNGIMPR